MRIACPTTSCAELRRAAPVWWNSQPGSGFDDDGFWVVSKHADIMEISRNSDLFGSWENTAIIRHGGDIKDSIDLQRLISAQHRPSAAHQAAQDRVARLHPALGQIGLRDKLTERAERIVAAALQNGTGDFVTEVAERAAAAGDRRPARGSVRGSVEAVRMDEHDGRRRGPRIRRVRGARISR